MITTNEADRITRSHRPVKMRDLQSGRTFTTSFHWYDRWNIYSNKGGGFTRSDLEIIRKGGRA